MTRKVPAIVAGEPIAEAFQQAEAKLAEHREWDGDDTPAVRTAQYMIALFENAVRRGAELWKPTAEAARITEWDAQTLTKWARRKVAGETVPFAWRSMKARRDPTGYVFQVSTIPPKARKAS